jgi:hypothetical protein
VNEDSVALRDGLPVRLHAHDLPGLARFWTQALGWKVLSECESEILIGTGQSAPVGMCFMLCRSITRLGVSPALFADMMDAVVVGLPGAAQDRLSADVPGARPGRRGVPR